MRDLADGHFGIVNVLESDAQQYFQILPRDCLRQVGQVLRLKKALAQANGERQESVRCFFGERPVFSTRPLVTPSKLRTTETYDRVRPRFLQS